MRKNKPELFLIDDLLIPIDNNISELEYLLKNLDANIEGYLQKSIFIYSFSLFESSITDSLKHFLTAFPKKISHFKAKSLDNYLLYNAVFASDIYDSIIEEYIRAIQYEGFREIFKEIYKIFELKKEDHFTYHNKDLIERKERRNIVVHNNSIVDRKYIINTNNDPSMLGNKLEVDNLYLVKTLKIFLSILKQFRNILQAKYGKYNRIKLIKDVWNYVFDTPLLVYKNIWDENGSFILPKHQYPILNGLSSSEKVLFSYWMQHYNSGIIERFFEFKHLDIYYESNGMLFLVEFFSEYPSILQYNAI